MMNCLAGHRLLDYIDRAKTDLQSKNTQLNMQNNLSSSTVLFVAKLKDFLDSIGVTFDEFIHNFQTINSNQISRLQFFRIVSLIHIETYNNFDPLQVLKELTYNKETIPVGELKKLVSMVGELIKQKKQGSDKAREQQMKKKVVKIGTHKLQEFINQHPNPILFFYEFDSDGNGAINKVEFSKMLVATDIRQFASKDIRKMLIDSIFKYFPKGQMTIQELTSFFKIKNKPPSEPQSANLPQRPNATFDAGKSPNKFPIQDWADPFKKKQPPQKYQSQDVQKPVFPEPKPHHDPFQKKQVNPYLQPTQPNGYQNPKSQPFFQNHISNCNNLYPLSMKYYRQGEPQPSEYQVLEELQALLKYNKQYIDKENPRANDGSYTSAADIFPSRFYIFQMASSVLMRQKSRIGIAQQIQPKDIIQGSVGDCYFLSSIASIISIYPQLIAERFLLNINPSNFYAVKLFIDGEWKIITTDDRFPCKGKYPVYAKPHHSQIWVMLLEKCWAKVFGGYKAIEAGSSKQGFIALTGAPCEIVGQQDQKEQAQAIKQLQNAHKKRYVATMSGSNYLDSLGKKGQELYGLISGHAYSLLKIINIKGETLVKLRNPWGKLIWKGDWSFASNKWTKDLRDKYNYHKNPEDGSFYMSWKDFRTFFGEIIICKLNPTFMHDSIRCKSNRHKSGYFRMEVKTPGQYILSIYQENKRKMNQKYSNYQYSQARLIILKRQGNEMKFIGSRSSSQYQVCSVDVELDEGEYIISAKVVWKFWEDHQFVLTSYGTDHTLIAPINRSIAPEFKDHLIRSYSKAFAGTGKVKSYEKYGFNATCETNFSLETGIGFVKMVNKSDKGFESIQEYECKGIKVIKPDRLPLKFAMGPKSEKTYGFFISPAGFEYSNTEKIKY